MAQWNRLCNLPAVYRQQLDELYDKDVLPMEVRHYLAGWIEEQDWWGHPLRLHIMVSTDHKHVHVCLHVSCFIVRKRAAQDYDLAMVLYQVLLGNLDIQHSRFVHTVAFLQRHNIRRYKQNFQVGGSSMLRWVTHWMLEEISQQRLLLTFLHISYCADNLNFFVIPLFF